MNHFFSKLFFLLLLTPVLSVTIKAQCECLEGLLGNDAGVLGKYAVVEKLFDGGFFTEGPASRGDGSVYFSDITFSEEFPHEKGHIFKYSPASNETVIFRSPSGMSNGLIFDIDDNLLICEGADGGGRRLLEMDVDSGRSRIIVDQFNGARLNSPNDIVIDESGNIYFTDPRYTGNEKVEQPVSGIYRVTKKGVIELLISNINMPNGIAITPDQEFLYIGSFDESTFAFKEQDGLLKGNFIARYKMSKSEIIFDKIFYCFEGEAGPDGLTVDGEGNLYVAVRDEETPAVYVFNENSKIIEFIPLPEVPSNVEFGRLTEDNVLYITAGGSLYRVLTNKRGYHPRGTRQ